MRDCFFLKRRNISTIIVSLFYWTMCWLFCNNCHSILLAHYPNESWLRCHDHIFLGYRNNVSSSRWTECTVRRNRGNLRLGKVLDLWFFIQTDCGTAFCLVVRLFSTTKLCFSTYFRQRMRRSDTKHTICCQYFETRSFVKLLHSLNSSEQEVLIVWYNVSISSVCFNAK